MAGNKTTVRSARVLDGRDQSLIPPLSLDTEDGIANSIRVMLTTHANVHAGDLYSAHHEEVGVAQNGTLLMQFDTGAKYTHFKRFEVYTDKEDARFEILEDPNLTDGTSEIRRVNRNRTSSNVSTITIYSDPTSITGGFKLEDIRFGSGDKKAGSDSRSNDLELILALNTTYLIRLTNLGSQAAILYTKLFWYEKTGNTP